MDKTLFLPPFSILSEMNRITEKQRRKIQAYKELEALAVEMNFTIDAIIVEGPHDKKTLKILGFKKPIIKCSRTRLSHIEIADYVSKNFSKITILTDFDEEGRKLNKKLKKHLERKDVKIEELYRRKFWRLLKEVGILTLESIYGLKKELFF